jgi:exodeoxyribonuclease-5
MLTEIHRQAAESAIIRLATMARQGEPIGFGEYDRSVAKMRKADVTPDQALRSGQLICGMNATRLQLNNAMRHAAGFGAGVLPSGPDEKIICLKNQNDIGLINGMFVTLEDVVDEGSLFFSAVVKDEGGKPVQPPDANGAPGRLRIYKGHFEDHVDFDRERHDRDWREKRKLTEATFGWAITAHKAQGSQWEGAGRQEDVGFGRGRGGAAIPDRRRWSSRHRRGHRDRASRPCDVRDPGLGRALRRRHGALAVARRYQTRHDLRRRRRCRPASGGASCRPAHSRGHPKRDRRTHPW